MDETPDTDPHGLRGDELATDAGAPSDETRPDGDAKPGEGVEPLGEDGLRGDGLAQDA